MHRRGSFATIFACIRKNIFTDVFFRSFPCRPENDIRASQILPYAVGFRRHSEDTIFRFVNENREKPVLNRFEIMELAFGMCTLGALMWLLWLNGFDAIHEDQVSLRYFREILSLLVLGQLAGAIGILRENGSPRPSGTRAGWNLAWGFSFSSC